MALDKLVDSSQLDADLLSVANAIRTKGGTSASLAFPAGFVDAIDDIPTGGGGVESGSVTFSEQTQAKNYVINVGSSFDFFVMFPTTTPLGITGTRTVVAIIFDNTRSSGKVVMWVPSNASGTGTLASYGNSTAASQSGKTLVFGNISEVFPAGITYEWFAW